MPCRYKKNKNKYKQAYGKHPVSSEAAPGWKGTKVVTGRHPLNEGYEDV